MSFLEKMRKLAEQICKRKDSVRGESQTKQSLIIPFIRTLGYDVDDPDEVDVEFRADVGVKRGERVDYAIMQDRKPIILVECKKRERPLKDAGKRRRDAYTTQLYRYFNATDAKIGMLSNGIEYQFFIDEKKPNIMDAHPFFEFDVCKFEDSEAHVIKWLTKTHFDKELMVVAAKEQQASVKSENGHSLEVPIEEFIEPVQPHMKDAIATENSGIHGPWA